MRGTSTLEALVGRVHMQSRGNFDEAIPVADLEFDSLGTARISGKEVAVLPSAQRLIAGRLRVPISYLERCPQGLAAHNLNYWIKEEAKSRETLFCRFSAKGLRALFTERYVALDHLEILLAMLDNGVAPNQEVQFTLDDSLMLVKMPRYDGVFSVAHKDRIVPGCCLANSETGILALCLEAYFFRLVCSNGLIAKASTGMSRFKHISRKALEGFPAVLSQAVSDAQKGKDRFLISLQTPVANSDETFSRLNAQMLVTKKMADAVSRAWPSEEGGTMFHILNTYTRAAQDAALDAEESMHLERVGGAVLGLLRQ